MELVFHNGSDTRELGTEAAAPTNVWISYYPLPDLSNTMNNRAMIYLLSTLLESIKFQLLNMGQ